MKKPMTKGKGKRESQPIAADTCFWGGLANDRDQYFNIARELMLTMRELAILPLAVNDYIIDETVTLLNPRIGYQRSLKIYDYLASKCHVFFMKPAELEAVSEIFMAYKGALSFTDAAIVHTMRREGMRRLLSFDSRFDRVKDIERIYDVGQL